jgi:hypothetical protein
VTITRDLTSRVGLIEHTELSDLVMDGPAANNVAYEGLCRSVERSVHPATRRMTAHLREVQPEWEALGRDEAKIVARVLRLVGMLDRSRQLGLTPESSRRRAVLRTHDGKGA